MKDPWMTAIQAATNHVFGGRNKRNQSDNAANESLQYFIVLEDLIAQEGESNWNQVPACDPPPFVPSQTTNTTYRNINPPTSLYSNNQYAGLFNTHSLSVDEPPAAVAQSRTQAHHSSERLTMRRLMIRILSIQADLEACLACTSRQERRWLDCARHCAVAWSKTLHAISVCDTHLSHTYERLLAEDGNVVSVSCHKTITERDTSYLKAKRQKAKLEQRLLPQWETRDSVKEKLGDRWFNNPNPKRDHAKIREADENELKEVSQAIELLDELQVKELEAKLNEKISTSNNNDNHDSNNNNNNNRNSPDRYNGLRPRDLSMRVSIQEYPDPTEFEWSFTGANEESRVEFFEKQFGSDGLVKLDWYYTTGTIKTSLHHATQGPTQLFGAQVTSENYIEILLNPRSHTNNRYHRKPRSNRRPGRGNGRGGRRPARPSPN